MKKIKKSKKELIIITIIGTLALILAIILCVLSIKGKDEYVMHYSDNSKLDYNVYLKKNNFYTTSYLPKNRVYVSNLIDYIDSYFNYDFKVVEDINLGYKYYVNAKVVINGDNDKKIFEKEEILIDKTEVQQVSNKEFSISENVKVDYNKYNDLASSFIDEYDLSVKANVIVSLYVEVEGTSEKFENKLNDSAVVSFEIPLTTKTNMTEIKMNYDLTNNSNKSFEYGKTSIVHPILFGLSIIIALVAVAWVIYEIFMYVTSMDVKEKYQEKLKKIFRDYGPYISKKAMTSNTKEIMYTMSLRVEIVNTFDDLINVRDSIEKPILFYESVPGEQAVFYIIDTKVSYIYIMNARDLDTRKKESLDSSLFEIKAKKQAIETTEKTLNIEEKNDNNKIENDEEECKANEALDRNNDIDEPSTSTASFEKREDITYEEINRSEEVKEDKVFPENHIDKSSLESIDSKKKVNGETKKVKHNNKNKKNKYQKNKTVK